MKSIIETITPKKAQRLLDVHWIPEKQRKPSPSIVSSFARTMRAGEWVLTHQGIAITEPTTDSPRGELIDGVQRLHAVIESGTPIKIMVSRGVPYNGNGNGIYTIDAIDRGRERGVGQQLQLRHNISSGNQVAAVCRGILWLCAASRKKLIGKFTVANALHVLDIYGAEVEYTQNNRSQDYGVRSSPVCSAAAFAMKACPTQIKEFYAQLTTGELIVTADPAMTCRRWLMNKTDKQGRLSEYRGVLNCAMKHVLKEKTSKVYDANERGYAFFADKQRGSIIKLLTSCGFDE